jgi:tetratricopeptide (TPR) repeat protein
MSKKVVVVGALLVAILPWFGGGRDAIGLLLSAFSLVIAAFFTLREGGLRTSGTWLMRPATGLWLIWGTLSILWSVNRFQSEVWVAMMVMAVVAAMIAAQLSLEDRIRLITGYRWVAAGTAALGIIMYLVGDYNRLTSTFYWANPAAAFLLPALIIGVWRWLETRAHLDLALVGLTAIGFWLTDSRGGTLTLVLMLGIALILSRKLRRQGRRWLFLAVATFALAFGLSVLKAEINPGSGLELGSRYQEAAQGESTSVKDRFSYLDSAFRIWWGHPLMGTGAGTFGTVHPQYQSSPINASTDVHNFYVQTLSEQGLIGAALLAWVVILVLMGVWRGVAAHPQQAVVGLSVLALLVHAGLDIDARYPALLLLAAVLIGVTYQPWHRVSITGGRRLVMPALLAVLLLIVIPYYQSDAARSRGQIYDDNRDLTTAAKNYQRAHRGPVYDPDTLTAEGIDYFTLATFTNGSKTFSKQARDLANQAIQRDPQDAQHYFLLGRAQFIEGNLKESEQAYRMALKLDKYNHAEYYEDLAALQLKVGDTVSAQRTVDEALAIYTDAVIANRNGDEQMPPAVAQLLAFRAAAEIDHGDHSAAAKSLQRAYRLDPKNRDVELLQRHLKGQVSA